MLGGRRILSLGRSTGLDALHDAGNWVALLLALLSYSHPIFLAHLVTVSSRQGHV